MKRSLDHALAQIPGKMTGLRAVVLSAAPDGLIAWSWARDDKHELALGFAALDRAATVCLTSLGASDNGRSLLLSAENTWVASWPVYDSAGPPTRRERLVVTTVFSGELQSGMVMVYGSRLRIHIRAALDDGQVAQTRRLRAALVNYLVAVEAPNRALADIARNAQVDLRRLARPESLTEDQARRVLELTHLDAE